MSKEKRQNKENETNNKTHTEMTIKDVPPR